MECAKWLRDLPAEVTRFMKHMRSKTVPGYYRYSYSGDLYDERTHWNLGAAVFALKIHYTLGTPFDAHLGQICKYLLSFQNSRGFLYDPFVYRRSFFPNWRSALKIRRRLFFGNKEYIGAETRQSLCALHLYEVRPPRMLRYPLPQNRRQIEQYLSRLAWNYPWSAGSHFSHLMFFYREALRGELIPREKYEQLTDHAVAWVNRLQHEGDGCWYKGNVDTRNKLHGAMKVITGLLAIINPQSLGWQQDLDR